MAVDTATLGPGGTTGSALLRRGRDIGLAVGAALVLLVAWELLSRADTIYLPRADVPPPSEIVQALYRQVQLAAFWDALGATLKGWSLGLLLAILAGVPLGVVIGSSRTAFLSSRAVIEFLRPIPSLTLLPLLVLVIGIRFNLKLALVGLGCFWPILVQTVYGVQDVDPLARDMARAYGLGRTRIFAQIVLPSSLPYIVTGLRLAAILALNIAIGVELIVGSTGGMGVQINLLQLANRIPEMYAYIVAAAIVGLAINFLVRRVERWSLHWHASQREAVAK
jgi:ABC-type nitrate/sulfonate/bicarbonate transport system permease component